MAAATRSRDTEMRFDAPSIWIRPGVSATPDRNSNGSIFSSCGYRVGYRCFRFLAPETAHAQEYPWCVSREGFLECAYTTHEQCQWSTSGVGGCDLNPRLLFSNTPGHPDATSKRRPKTY